MIYTFELKNGIRCIVNKIDGVFSVTSGILVGAGSFLENEKENGISHYIEHVNFKGTTTRSAYQISSGIDNLGAQINAFTSKEFTCYYVKSTSEHFSKSLEILADLFANSVYDEEELKKERGVIIEEINMYEDTPDEVCSDNLASAFYGDRGFGATILGTRENVNSFDRKSVLDYKKKYYTTDNIVVSIAGAVDIEKTKVLLEKYLGDIDKSEKSAYESINTVNLCKNVYANKDIEQAHIALSIESPKLDDKLSDAYSVICGALGGGMSSRLFQTVREKMALCYSIYSYNTAYVPCGNMTVYAGVGLNNYKPAFNAILEEMYKLKREGVTEEEFLRTREQMKSAFVLAQESTASQMILFGKYLLLIGKVFDMNKRIEEINRLTLSHVNEVIKNTFETEKMATSIVGNGVEPLAR